MANTSRDDWDEGSPAIGDPRRNGAAEIRYLRGGVADRLAKEHIVPATAGAGGEHKSGSAVSYYQASAPTTKPDGTTLLDSDDKGRIWIDSDDQSLHVWNGSAWVGAAQETFTKNSDGTTADTTFPYTQSGLSNGTWMVFVYGTLEAAPGIDAYTASLTVNAVTRELYIGNHPDGCAPFYLPFQVTVASGSISISAATYITRIQGMTGYRIA